MFISLQRERLRTLAKNPSTRATWVSWMSCMPLSVLIRMMTLPHSLIETDCEPAYNDSLGVLYRVWVHLYDLELIMWTFDPGSMIHRLMYGGLDT
jgi:hypothetical protein